MLQKNKDPMFLIESEAMDFIRDTSPNHAPYTQQIVL